MRTSERTRPWLLLTALLVAWALLSGCSKHESKGGVQGAAPLHAAVAANFAVPMARLVEAFRARSGHDLKVSTGSSGKLYAQIENGAPFHVFLSADEQRPARLEGSGLALRGSRFTYALGRLALFGPGLRDPSDGPSNLRSPELTHVAIANPKTAPYGKAAEQTLQKLGLLSELEGRIVQGENIAQTYHFAESGAAELGFVALASVLDQPKERYWLVPQALHAPIRQDAVLLARGAEHPAARAFLAFLRGQDARAIIERAGYGAP